METQNPEKVAQLFQAGLAEIQALLLQVQSIGEKVHETSKILKTGEGLPDNVDQMLRTRDLLATTVEELNRASSLFEYKTQQRVDASLSDNAHMLIAEGIKKGLAQSAIQLDDFLAKAEQARQFAPKLEAVLVERVGHGVGELAGLSAHKGASEAMQGMAPFIRDEVRKAVSEALAGGAGPAKQTWTDHMMDVTKVVVGVGFLVVALRFLAT